MVSNANKVVVDVELRAQLSQMKAGVKELEGIFKNLNLTPAKNASLTQDFAKYKANIKEIEDLLSQPLGEKGLADVGKRLEANDKLMNSFKKTLSTLGGYSDSQLQKIFPSSFTNTVKQAVAVLGTYEQKLADIKAQDADYAKTNSELEQKKQAWQELSNQLEKYKEALESVENNQALKNSQIQNFDSKDTQASIKAWQDKQDQITKTTAKLEELKASYQNMTAETKQSSEGLELFANIEKKKQELDTLNADLVTLKNNAKDNITLEIMTKADELNAAKAALEEVQQRINTMDSAKAQQAFEQVKSELQQIQGLNIDWNKVTNLEEFSGQLNKLSAQQLQQVRQSLEQGSNSIKNVGNASQEAKGKIDQAATSLQQMAQQMGSFTQLAQRGMYFLGLANQVQLFKRAIKQAFSAVKELDKAMTETAVVTNFSVGDMWEQMPKYSNIAREYNATLKDSYEVMTLYYQQGLKTNQVFEVGEQTMKMARIAGLDYSVATDRMTNALRGFNMEVNSMNSEHIADVYSQLAAMSASNVKELSVAMTKVASLANSANMSFDNTAAFLAQIIETTRESAETAGTALKTVVARFSEVKKLYSEGDLVGDVDGEEININKVGAALRAAGVDLNQFMTGAKGLDEIFIELAGKWDSLDLLTQRYIATMAAGSRQQSRFLALMSDNERLTELLNGAYNAAGASSEQFAKTQESLQSKLNNLSVAWQQFLIGITNSDAIKGGVDILTKLVEGLNILTTTGDGITTSLSKIGLISNVFGLIRAGITSLVQQVRSDLNTNLPAAAVESTQKFGVAFKQGLQQSFSGFTKSGNLFSLSNQLFQIMRGNIDWSQVMPMDKLQESFAAIGANKSVFENSLQSIFASGEQITKEGTAKISIEIARGLTNSLNDANIPARSLGISKLFGDIATQAEQGSISLQQAVEKMKTSLTALKNSGKITDPAQLAEIDFLIEDLEKLGVTLDTLPTKEQQVQQKFEQMTAVMSKTQMILSGVSMAFNALGSIAEKVSGSNGGIAQFTRGIGGALTAASSVLMALTMITSALKTAGIAAKSFGTAMATAAPYLAAAAAIASILVTVIQYLNNIEIEAAKKTEELAQKAKEEAEANRELLKSYEDLEEAIENQTIDKEELEDKTRELIAAYDLEQQGLNALTSSYEEVAKAAKKAQQSRDLAAGVASQEAAKANRKVLTTKTKKGTSYERIRLSDTDIAPVLIHSLDKAISQYNWKDKISFENTGGYVQIKGLEELTESEFEAFIRAYEQAGRLYGSEWKDGSANDNMSAFQNEYNENISNLKDNIIDMTEALEDAYINSEETNLDQHFDTYGDYTTWLNSEAQRLIDLDDNLELSLDEAKNIVKSFYADYADERDAFYAKVESLYGDQNEDVVNYLNKLSEAEKRYLSSGKVLMTKDKTIEDYQAELAQATFDDYSTRGSMASETISDYLTQLASGEEIDSEYLDSFLQKLSNLDAINPQYRNAQEEWNAMQMGSAGFSNQADYLKQVQDQAIVQSRTFLDEYEKNLYQDIIDQAKDYDQVKNTVYFETHDQDYQKQLEYYNNIQELLSTYSEDMGTVSRSGLKSVEDYYQTSAAENILAEFNTELNWLNSAVENLAQRTVDENPDKTYDEAYKYWSHQTGQEIYKQLVQEQQEAEDRINQGDKSYEQYQQNVADQEDRKDTLGGAFVAAGFTPEDIQQFFTLDEDTLANTDQVKDNILTIVAAVSEIQGGIGEGEDGLAKYLGFSEENVNNADAMKNAMNNMAPILQLIGKENEYDLNTIEGQKKAYEAISSEIKKISNYNKISNLEINADAKDATEEVQKFLAYWQQLEKEKKIQKFQIEVNEAKTAAATIKKFNDTWNTMTTDYKMSAKDFEQAATDFPDIMDAFTGFANDGSIQLSAEKMKDLAEKYEELGKSVLKTEEEIQSQLDALNEEEQQYQNIASAMGAITDANEDQEKSWDKLSDAERILAEQMIEDAINTANANIESANSTMDANADVAQSAEQMADSTSASNARIAASYYNAAYAAAQLANASAAAKAEVGYTVTEHEAVDASKYRTAAISGATSSSDMKRNTGKATITGETKDALINAMTTDGLAIKVDDDGQYTFVDKKGNKVTNKQGGHEFTQEELATGYSVQGTVQSAWESKVSELNGTEKDLIVANAELRAEMARLGKWDDSGKGGGGGSGDSDKDKEDPRDIKNEQELNNIQRERNKLEKEYNELQEGGLYTLPLRLKQIKKEMDLLEKEKKIQEQILKDKQDIVEEKKSEATGWEKYLTQNDDGSFSYNEQYVIDSKNGKLSVEDEKLQELVEAGNNLADQQQTVDDIAYRRDELEDERDNSVNEAIDQGVDWVNTAIDGIGQVAQSMIQMVEAVAQSMVDGFKSFLGWLTIRIDDEHDIGELDTALKNRKELLDWEYDKLAEQDFDYVKGMNANAQANLFENINDAAQNVLIRLQNQRRLYENSFRNLEDLGTNINSDIEASLEQLYDALYGTDGVFTKINDNVQYLEARFEKALGWNLTKLREWDPITKINDFLGTDISDTINDALGGLTIFDGSLAKRFFEKSLQEIGGLELTEYRLGDVGESLLQKIANFFYELAPKFDADYQITNKAELVDALNQKMQTIITNDTITAQFVQNYLDYLTEIESQMESEVENIRNAESEILSLYDEMTEILEKGKEEYTDLEQQIYDAIVSEKESLKEELEELNSNITDADSNLIEVLKANLEQIRQQRDNDKTETDLRDKEARLAYLKQDSSGANKQEILKLEKELEEGQQSYTDKLIDQKISELEKQNDEAAEQRQIQIDLLQEEINNTKLIWEKVKQLMDAISGNVGWDNLLTGEIDREAYENIIEQLKKGQDFKDSSLFAQEQSIDEWGVLIRKASVYGTMLKDEYQKAYNDLKIIRNVLDEDTKLASDHAADSGWHDYVAFSNLETAVKDNTEAVQNAVSIINRIVDAKTLSFDEQGSVFKKATESGAVIQTMSGLESAIKAFAEDMASGLPGILTQVTTGVGNMAKGMLKLMGASLDSVTGAVTFDIEVGDMGEAAGMLIEGVSNFFAAGVDAASLMCDIIGDTSPGFTDMGVAAGTLIANWLFNAYEEVDEHLQKNVNAILEELYGDELDGERIGGSYQTMAETIANEKDALIDYYRENGRTLEDSRNFVNKLFDGIDKTYADINAQIAKLDLNDIEGYNKQYSRFLALEKVIEAIGHTDSVEKWSSNSISNIEKWAGEVGSIFAEISEKERQIVVDAINSALYPVISEETLPNGDSKATIWEDSLKFKVSDIKYYNDIYKEFVDDIHYSVDAIDEAITALNSIYYDPFENEYTSPSAQLLIQKLQNLEPKRAEQEIKIEKSIWETFIDKASDAWGEFGNKILTIVEGGKSILQRIYDFLTGHFGNVGGAYAVGGVIKNAQKALVGELGPELVQHANGTATLVGKGGPEIANLKAGDMVYTADQTKKILNGKGGLDFNRFAEGTVGTFMARAPLAFAIKSIDVNGSTRALNDQGSRENNFNLNLNLEGLTVDSPDRVEEVANRVWDKLNDTVSGAMWPYNKL